MSAPWAHQPLLIEQAGAGMEGRLSNHLRGTLAPPTRQARCHEHGDAERGVPKGNRRAILESIMLADRPTTASDAIETMLADPSLEPLVAAHRVLEPRPPRYAPWPEGLDPRLVTALRSRGVEALYTHQAQSVEAIRAGHNACVVTPTASGKTLCYNLPVLEIGRAHV